jgi:hypothetical protein
MNVYGCLIIDLSRRVAAHLHDNTTLSTIDSCYEHYSWCHCHGMRELHITCQHLSDLKDFCELIEEAQSGRGCCALSVLTGTRPTSVNSLHSIPRRLRPAQAY